MAAASFLQFKLAAGKGPPPLSLPPLPHGIRCITSEFAQSPDSLLTNPKETKTKEEEKKKGREGGIRRRGRGSFETHESFSLEGQWVRVDGS